MAWSTYSAPSAPVVLMGTLAWFEVEHLLFAAFSVPVEVRPSVERRESLDDAVLRLARTV